MVCGRHSGRGEKTAASSRYQLEGALGHQIGTPVERAYRRTDNFQLRRTVMQAWANFSRGKRIKRAGL